MLQVVMTSKRGNVIIYETVSCCDVTEELDDYFRAITSLSSRGQGISSSRREKILLLPESVSRVGRCVCRCICDAYYREGRTSAHTIHCL